MKLNKKVELGMKAVNVLKNRTVPTRVVDIAAEVGTSVNFLEQVMRHLRVAGVVSVKRGPGGGYTLRGGDVTAFDVAYAVGRDMTYSESDVSPSTRLSNAIVDAFSSVVI